MPGLSEWWQIIEPVVTSTGLELFDLDLPGSSSKVLRVFIERPRQEGQEGVSLEDCVAVTKLLSATPKIEEMLPENGRLEVSSPGINRRLRRPEHFKNAIGEHLKIKKVNKDGSNETLFGELLDFKENELYFLRDGSDEKEVIEFDQLLKARIDFLFA